MDSLKACVDCKHYEEGYYTWAATCKRPLPAKWDVVHGWQEKKVNVCCRTSRSGVNKRGDALPTELVCGEQAIFWERKPREIPKDKGWEIVRPEEQKEEVPVNVIPGILVILAIIGLFGWGLAIFKS